jgi:uncharacterized protein (TIGR03435 family)
VKPTPGKTKIRLLLGAIILTLAAVVVAVKLLFFPTVKSDYFSMDYRSLQHAPSGMVMIRPTRFPFLRDHGILYVPSPHHETNVFWVMGRNVPLRTVFAVAYQQNPTRVVLPSDAPKTNFDFLVTLRSDARAALKTVLRQKLGYAAQTETRDTDVLALKIKDANLPGLKVSGDDEKRHVDYNDLNLQVRHLPLLMLAGDRLRLLHDALEQILPLPVVDKTGLTNLYDYTIAWNMPVKRQLDNEATARPAVDKILGDWGLGLEPDTASLEMLVVTKAK